MKAKDFKALQLKSVLEDQVQEDILAELRLRRIPATRTEAKRSYNESGKQVQRIEPGWPDITGCLPATGKLLAIECKRPVGGKLRYLQAICLQALWEAGAVILIARSVDDVTAMLTAGRTPAETIAEIVETIKKGPKK